MLCFNQFQDHGRYGARYGGLKALNTMKALESRKDHFREFAPDFSASPQMMFGICAAPAAIAGAKNLDASMGGETLHSCCQHCQHGFFHA